MGLAIGLLAVLPGVFVGAAQTAAEQPVAPAPLHPRNQPPPPDLPPPPPPVSSDIAGPGLSAFRIPPRPEYPVEALRNDLSGRCIVTFTVHADGALQDIVPDCSDPVFTIAAHDAVAAARVKMDAEIKPGQTLRLPLRFQTADSQMPQD